MYSSSMRHSGILLHLKVIIKIAHEFQQEILKAGSEKKILSLRTSILNNYIISWFIVKKS